MRRGPRDERGAVAIVVAMCVTGLLVVAAMVLDFGLVRVDRQVHRSAADAATLAGLHGLNAGDGLPHPYAGVCTAIRYLRANNERFAGIDESTGWRNGTGAPTGNGCTDPALRRTICRPADRSSWARWSWSGVVRGLSLTVVVESGYDLTTNRWAEDDLPATTGDDGAAAYGGCDNLAVTVSQSREPGFGSLATAADLTTRIRSVGRVEPVPGSSAPALLLLKRTGCPVLVTGSNGGQSYIRVLGAVATDGSGRTQPGTIHSDSDGVGCDGGNNGWIFGGLASNGIVAHAAPLAANPLMADPTKPGSITSVAVLNGLSGTTVRDSLDQVHASSSVDGSTGTKSEVTGRSLVTRRLVDERYFGGVKTAVTRATAMFASGSAGPPASDWVRFGAGVDACKPSQADVDALNLTVASKLYVDCSGKFVGAHTGLTLNAGTVYFRGWVNPGSGLRLPLAHHVYVGNHGGSASAIDLGNNSSFEVSTSGNTDASGLCSTGTSSSKALVVVRSGAFKQTGGTLRMCRVSAILMGGSADACVPAAPGSAPTSSPCTGSATPLGNGQFSQNGGDIDWSAPNVLDATVAADGTILPSARSAWQDPDGPEDLALWSESASSSSSTYSMTGGGLFRVRGVFMVPNADPFILSGGASLSLVNAQYIASSIRLNGNTTNVTLKVDPNSAITLPDQGVVGLVR